MVSSFNWSQVKVDFDTYLVSEKLALEEREKKYLKLKKTKEPDAREMWWLFCKENPSSVDIVNYYMKERIIALIMKGQTPSEALNAEKNLNA